MVIFRSFQLQKKIISRCRDVHVPKASPQLG